MPIYAVLGTLRVSFYAILIPSFMLVKSLGGLIAFMLIIPPALGGMAWNFHVAAVFINIPRDLIDASKLMVALRQIR